MMITATQAIKTIETLGGYKFVRRYRYLDRYSGRSQIAYAFTSSNGQWDHETTFDSLGQLRFYAKQFAYTHGVDLA